MPSWKDYERFLLHDGWEYVPGNSGTDRFYRKVFSDGEVRRTRVSKSSKEIGKNLFAEILKNQARASKEYFAKVLSNKRNSNDDPAKRY
ncbi:MAG: type II toxin-antitoxin system HicA family toxin [Acidobacteriota bacterium]|jgi:predicted RNA binding protein YcfA (HicA-like mRNA interferase family)|nr:type II toxin-antitoxin system HicA family toxin [Acidobacteriota bacterium]